MCRTIRWGKSGFAVAVVLGVGILLSVCATAGSITSVNPNRTKGATPPLTKEERVLVQKTIELVCKVLGYPASPNASFSWRRTEDMFQRRNRIQVEAEFVEFCVETDTGRIASVSNKQVYRSQAKWEALPDPLPAEYKVTQESKNVVETALRFARAFTAMPETYTTTVEFMRSGVGRGRWRVLFRRTLAGFPYDNDLIRVTVADNTGEFLSFGRYAELGTCPTEVRIGESEAEHTARDIATKYAKRSLDAGYGRLIELTIVSTEIRIINPNHFFAKVLERNVNLPEAEILEPTCRLAYVVRIACRFDKMRDENQPTITVWVDAGTGEILGGWVFPPF